MLRIRKRNLAPHQIVSGFGVFAIGMVSSIGILHALNAPEQTSGASEISTKVQPVKTKTTSQTKSESKDETSVVAEEKTAEAAEVSAPAFGTPYVPALSSQSSAPAQSPTPSEQQSTSSSSPTATQQSPETTAQEPTPAPTPSPAPEESGPLIPLPDIDTTLQVQSDTEASGAVAP